MRIRIDRAVWAELDAIVAWYELERPGLGDQFVTAFDDALTTIARHPEACAEWRWGATIIPPLRHHVMRRFPYVIGFQVLDDDLIVSHLVHGRRRPGRR